MKATYGLISRHGVFPLSWSLDHTGPMARSVEDVAMLLGVLAGHDPLDPSTAHQSSRSYLQSPLPDLKGCRFAVADYAYVMIEPEVTAVFDQSLKQLERLGATIETIYIEGLNDAQVSHLTIVVSEATAFHEPYLRDKAHLYGRFALSLLEAGRLVSAPQYLKAQQFRRVFTERMIKQLKGFDAMLLPTLPLSPPRIEAETVTIAGVSLPSQNAMLHFCWPANFVGLPTLSLPNGFTPDVMPSSLMLMGAPFSEDRLLRMAHVYEQSCNWKEARPKI